MRKTREELLQSCPSWNEARHDIVKVKYGEQPLIRWNEEKYKEYQKLTGTLANLEAVGAFMWTQMGNYDTYRPLIGEVHVKEDGTVFAGDLNVKIGGRTYNIIINKMFGIDRLDILRLGGQYVTGFSNVNGQGSPSRYAKEMEKETIEKVLNCRLEDYGEAIQGFMRVAREIYNADAENHIMGKLFTA